MYNIQYSMYTVMSNSETANPRRFPFLGCLGSLLLLELEPQSASHPRPPRSIHPSWIPVWRRLEERPAATLQVIESKQSTMKAAKSFMSKSSCRNLAAKTSSTKTGGASKHKMAINKMEHTKSHQEKLCWALGHGNSTAWQFSEKQPRFRLSDAFSRFHV